MYNGFAFDECMARGELRRRQESLSVYGGTVNDLRSGLCSRAQNAAQMAWERYALRNNLDSTRIEGVDLDGLDACQILEYAIELCS